MNKYTSQVKPEEISLDFNEKNDVSDVQVVKELKKAMQSKTTLNGYCSQCLEDGTLELELGEKIKGIIPREEVSYKLDKDGLVHLGKCQSRVGLNIQFKVKELKAEPNGNIVALLSRKDAVLEVKERYSKELKVGSIVEGVVIGIQQYAAFIDIGGDVSGLLSIRDILRVPISHPSEALTIGQSVEVVVTQLENNGDNLVVSFSRKELLPTFEEIDKYFKLGATVVGKVKKVWDTGIFVQLNESYEGLADFVPERSFKYGDKVRVKIAVIDKTRKKIKLRIIG